MLGNITKRNKLYFHLKRLSDPGYQSIYIPLNYSKNFHILE